MDATEHQEIQVTGGSVSSRNHPGPGVLASVILLCLIAGLALVWPVYRSSLNIKINENEGWNAYFADAAMGRMPLYPSPDKLITNNYPPLSFYVAGAAGKLIGDNILAGRLISLAAVLVLAFLIARIVKEIGGDRIAGLVGGAFFIATLCFFFDNYVGMNEPQLPAHAIMVFGFLLFLRAAGRDRGYALPILIMVTAGFFKHNIIALPLSALVWLAVQRRWKPLARCLAASLFLMALGFAACHAAYGRDFFFNFLAPRVYSFEQEKDALVELQCVAVVLAVWLFAGFAGRSDRAVQLLNILILTGLAVHFLQRTGAGVDINSQLDLVIAASIAAGFLFSRAGRLSPARRVPAGVLQAGFVLAICLRLIICENSRDVLNVASAGFRREIARREKIVEKTTALVRTVPGDVLCDPYVCYRAGKPFVVDEFNLDERISMGKMPEDAVTKRLDNHTLTKVETDPDIEW